MKLMSILVIGLLGLFSTAATQSLTVGTGAANATYSSMFKDMGQVCAASSFLKELHTGGSLDNVNLLLNNKVSLAFLQLDVLKAKEQIDKDPRVADIKVLLPLHKEEVHFIAKAGTHKDGLFSKPTVYTTLSQFAGKSVGAWGGSVISAKVISAFTNTAYKIVVFSDQKSALSALESDKIDGILSVVGQPSDWVSKLPASYKSITIPFGERLSGLYSPAKLSYPNLSLGSTNTISVQSVLATRDFKTSSKRDQLLKYSACIKNKLVDLQETEGYHPKWNDVAFGGFDTWPVYK